MNKKSSQKKVVVHKQKLTTLSSTKLRSTKLSGVVKKCVDKKVWSGETKTGWVTNNNPHTTTSCHILSLLQALVTTKLLHAILRYVVFPYVVLKKPISFM